MIELLKSSQLGCFFIDYHKSIIFFMSWARNGAVGLPALR